ncbi:hypothetical protein JGW40_001249 [Salmonella enterica]|uniref:KasI n=1 Tax=Kluyvera ascorbata TaxID=51288 RepID=F1KC53_9ENTR|nr:hypothetical protein [Citrobacter freundii]ADX97306.1 KasI [Kluyvera ascorbata]EGW7634272.1 hypothetical protein [Salmonella enterica]MDK2369836.1 hypothetical protein [Citrobacter freundii]HDX6531943.1 hypothetical protein [Escherichia coli]
MSVIPCKKDLQLKKLIESYAEALKVEAHKLGEHGLTEAEFYDSGLFRGAIERIRGQFSATMREKRNFVKHVLNYMQDNDYIADWESAGESNRHDYMVTLNSGRKAAIELKGCLDGNNTNIFDRPPQAEEFVIWSVCTNPGADPQHNVWSGLHTRLSAEIISREQRIDGMVIWDWACGTVGRPCPKIATEPERAVTFGPFKLPPPCLYLLPSTIPSPRNNPSPRAQQIEDVQLIKAFHDCFGCRSEEVNFVNFDVGYHGKDTVRKTTIIRNGMVERESEMTAIRRS